MRERGDQRPATADLPFRRRHRGSAASRGSHMIDPAVIAAVAASAANQREPDSDAPATLGGLLFSAVVVFGLAGLIVWACQFFCCGT